MTTPRHSVLIACALVAGCGRLGYDALDNGATPDAAPTTDASTTDPTDATTDASTTDPPDAAVNSGDLQLIDNRPDSIEVRVEGRFSLTFSADHRWQVTAWHDLVTPDESNLANSGATKDKSVLQSPVRVIYGPDTLTLDNARNASLELVTVSPTRIELKTEWLWDTFDMKTLEGEAKHVVYPDGTWDVEGEVKHPPGDLALDRVEYATSNVNDTLDWDSAVNADFSSYTHAFTHNDNRVSELHVESQENDPMAMNGNQRYWTRDNVTATADGWTVFWTNRISTIDPP